MWKRNWLTQTHLLDYVSVFFFCSIYYLLFASVSLLSYFVDGTDQDFYGSVHRYFAAKLENRLVTLFFSAWQKKFIPDEAIIWSFVIITTYFFLHSYFRAIKFSKSTLLLSFLNLSLNDVFMKIFFFWRNKF